MALSTSSASCSSLREGGGEERQQRGPRERTCGKKQRKSLSFSAGSETGAGQMTDSRQLAPRAVSHDREHVAPRDEPVSVHVVDSEDEAESVLRSGPVAATEGRR